MAAEFSGFQSPSQDRQRCRRSASNACSGVMSSRRIERSFANAGCSTYSVNRPELAGVVGTLVVAVERRPRRGELQACRELPSPVLTTDSGKPASRPTCTPYDRSVRPGLDAMQEDDAVLPLLHRRRGGCRRPRCDRRGRSTRDSGWQRACDSRRSASASVIAQASDRPSSVLVPRPISSRITRLDGVALCRMFAVSVISTMKVDMPACSSSLAPMRANT